MRSIFGVQPRITGTAHHAVMLLVGTDEEDVGWLAGILVHSRCSLLLSEHNCVSEMMPLDVRCMYVYILRIMNPFRAAVDTSAVLALTMIHIYL